MGTEGGINYEDLTPAYVTGLCEWGARFTYAKTPSNIAPRFVLKLPDPDRNLIFSLMRFFGCGNVYFGKNDSSWTFIASSSADLARITEHFDQYPLKGSRRDCYKVWRQLVELKKAFRRSDYGQIKALALALSEKTVKGLRREKARLEQELS